MKTMYVLVLLVLLLRTYVSHLILLHLFWVGTALLLTEAVGLALLLTELWSGARYFRQNPRAYRGILPGTSPEV